MGDFLPASFFKYIITAAQNLPILRPALALQKKKKMKLGVPEMYLGVKIGVHHRMQKQRPAYLHFPSKLMYRTDSIHYVENVKLKRQNYKLIQ